MKGQEKTWICVLWVVTGNQRCNKGAGKLQHVVTEAETSPRSSRSPVLHLPGSLSGVRVEVCTKILCLNDLRFRGRPFLQRDGFYTLYIHRGEYTRVQEGLKSRKASTLGNYVTHQNYQKIIAKKFASELLEKLEKENSKGKSYF